MSLLARVLLLASLLAALIGFGTSADSAASRAEPTAMPQQTEPGGEPKATRPDDIRRFQPSEELPSDSAVSFPVDI
jgi:hypothetical protein